MTKKHLIATGVAGLAMLLAAATAAASQANAHPTIRKDAVSAWNANAGKAAIAACISPVENPLHESRLYAMTHVAIHDALNAIDRRSRPYALGTRARRGASPDAAVAAAARDVLVPLLTEIPAPFPPECGAAGVVSVEEDYATALAAIPDGPAKARGLEVGKAAATAILALRAADGSDTPLLDSAYPQGTNPGEYRFTPDRLFAFAPGWAGVTPFVLRDRSQFRPGPPYEVTSRKYTAEFAEVKRLVGDGITTPSERSDEQVAGERRRSAESRTTGTVMGSPPNRTADRCRRATNPGASPPVPGQTARSLRPGKAQADGRWARRPRLVPCGRLRLDVRDARLLRERRSDRSGGVRAERPPVRRRAAARCVWVDMCAP